MNVLNIEEINRRIDEDFRLHVQDLWFIENTVKTGNILDNPSVFKDIVDVYLCKNNIPHKRESTGSGVIYCCPFTKNCSFRITSCRSRSKQQHKHGISPWLEFRCRKTPCATSRNTAFMPMGTCRHLPWIFLFSCCRNHAINLQQDTDQMLDRDVGLVSVISF